MEEGERHNDETDKYAIGMVLKGKVAIIQTYSTEVDLLRGYRIHTRTRPDGGIEQFERVDSKHWRKLGK